MLVFTGSGSYWTAVEDRDSDDLWLRSQDEASVDAAVAALEKMYPGRTYKVIIQPTWDYLARIKISKEEFGALLTEEASRIDYHKIKPTVAQAVGVDHPVSRMVAEIFYRMSENRPDGSLPGWMTGTPRAEADPAPGPEPELPSIDDFFALGDGKEFLVTFGVQYSREPHPVLGMQPGLGSTVWGLNADNEMVAREFLSKWLDGHYAFIYDGSDPEERDQILRHYPDGVTGALWNLMLEGGPTWLTTAR